MRLTDYSETQIRDIEDTFIRMANDMKASGGVAQSSQASQSASVGEGITPTGVVGLVGSLGEVTAGGDDGAVVALADGGFMVVWTNQTIFLETALNDTTTTLIAGRIFNADGTPRTDSFEINQYNNAVEADPTVIQLSGGEIVIAWNRQGTPANEGEDEAAARIFNPDGTAVTDEFILNQTLAESQGQVSITQTADGGFFTVWNTDQADTTFDDDLYGRYFNADGTAVGDEFIVQDFASFDAIRNGLVTTNDGRIYLVASGQINEIDGTTVTFRDSTNSPAPGSEFGALALSPIGDSGFVYAFRVTDSILQVNLHDPVNNLWEQFSVAVAEGTNPDTVAHIAVEAISGGYVVAWTQAEDTEASADVYARLYTQGGNAVGDAVLVHSASDVYQAQPWITQLESGEIVIGWTSDEVMDGARPRDLYFQTFNLPPDFGNEDAIGDDLTLNFQTLQTVATGDGGDFAVLQGTYTNPITDEGNTAVILQAVGPDGTLTGDPILIARFDSVGRTVDEIVKSFTIETLSDGGFAVAVAGIGGVKMRLFDADGAPRGDAITVTDGDANSIALVEAEDGLVIGFANSNRFSPAFGYQTFDLDGNPISPVISPTGLGDQSGIIDIFQTANGALNFQLSTGYVIRPDGDITDDGDGTGEKPFDIIQNLSGITTRTRPGDAQGVALVIDDTANPASDFAIFYTVDNGTSARLEVELSATGRTDDGQVIGQSLTRTLYVTEDFARIRDIAILQTETGYVVLMIQDDPSTGRQRATTIQLDSTFDVLTDTFAVLGAAAGDSGNALSLTQLEDGSVLAQWRAAQDGAALDQVASASITPSGEQIISLDDLANGIDGYQIVTNVRVGDNSPGVVPSRNDIATVDANRDGVTDLVFGVQGYGDGEGAAVLIPGGRPVPAQLEPGTNVGEQFVPVDYFNAGEFLRVEAAGDINRDGNIDYILYDGGFLSGESDTPLALVLGTLDGLPPALDQATIEGDRGLNLTQYDSVLIADAIRDPANPVPELVTYEGGIGLSGTLRFFDGSFGGDLSGMSSPSATVQTENVVSIALAGDINNDGAEDFLITSNELFQGQPQRTFTFLVYGNATTVGAPFVNGRLFDLSEGDRDYTDFDELDALGIQYITPQLLFAEAGVAATNLDDWTFADFNNDGFTDLFFDTTPSGFGDMASFTIFYGNASGFDQLATADTLDFQTVEFEKFDYREFTVGDYNGDGFDDIAFGVQVSNTFTDFDAPEIRIVLGGENGFEGITDLRQMDESDYISIQGEIGRTWERIEFIGDQNGDGREDLFIQTQSIDPVETGPISTYVIYAANPDRFVQSIGTSGDDVITGTDRRDLVFGQDGDDEIAGVGGDDYLIGNFGGDTIMGGDGADILVGDNILGLDGLEGQLYRAFRAVFDRAPDLTGFNAYLNEILAGVRTFESVFEGFLDSAEFTALYGSLDDTGFLTQLYLNVLGRDPDNVGLNAFLTALQNGDLTRADIVAQFIDSAEFIERVRLDSDAFATSVIISPLQADVYRLYQAAFDREPDLTGFTANSGSLEAGVRTLLQLAEEFVTSQEWLNIYSDNQTVDEFLTALYQNIFGRAPDDTGFTAYKAALESGDLSRAEVLVEFVQSYEFRINTDAAMGAFVAAFNNDPGDTLDGGAGDDMLYGGRGLDTFLFDALLGDNDIVADFELGVDVLNITGSADFDSFAEIMAVASQVGDNVMFDFGAGNTLLLRSVDLAELSEEDFGFSPSSQKQADLDVIIAEDAPIDDAIVNEMLVDADVYL